MVESRNNHVACNTNLVAFLIELDIGDMTAIDFYAILIFLLDILVTGWVVSLVIGHASGGDKYHLFRLLQDEIRAGIASLALCRLLDVL